MEYLFTPWRYCYVSSTSSSPAKKICIFCEKLAEENDEENLIVLRGSSCMVILNLYPYSTGHLMIVPYEHTPTIEKLAPPVLSEMMELATRCMGVLRDELAPQGFNIGINISRPAGAGIEDHVHMHVVPRWTGDSNFMSVTAETRVLPVDLQELRGRLAARLEG